NTMEIIYEMTGNTLTAQLMGELDHHAAAKVRSEIDDTMDSYGAKNLIFDFGKVTFMDSAGIGVVLGRYKRLQAAESSGGGENDAKRSGMKAGGSSVEAVESAAATVATPAGDHTETTVPATPAAVPATPAAVPATAAPAAAGAGENQAGSVVITGCSQKIYSILHMAGIFSLIKYTETKEEAITYLYGRKEVC
ncbi:MAG: anti-sigma factor antagonist, partial [Anaerovoracaceae bacterium]